MIKSRYNLCFLAVLTILVLFPRITCATESSDRLFILDIDIETVNAPDALATVTGFELLAVWPTVSVAVAVVVWTPLVAVAVFQGADHPSVPSVSTPRLTPSTKNSTWATPWSSVALATTRIVPDTVLPPAVGARLARMNPSERMLSVLTVVAAVNPSQGIGTSTGRYRLPSTIISVTVAAVNSSFTSTCAPRIVNGRSGVARNKREGDGATIWQHDRAGMHHQPPGAAQDERPHLIEQQVTHGFRRDARLRTSTDAPGHAVRLLA